MNVLEADLLPDELREWFVWNNQHAARFDALAEPGQTKYTLKPNQLHFFHKADLSRCEAWIACLKKKDMGDKNPWRKHHTENYWCWVLREN